MNGEKKEFIRVCPKCGSNNTTAGSLLIQSSSCFSYCKSCGYEGIFPEVEKNKVEKFKKMLRRKR